MTFKLRFQEQAWAEWQKLDGSVREPFKKKLAERLEQPRVPSASLHSMVDCYKIKLKTIGYRLIYRVEDNVLTVTVIAVGKRARNHVYTEAKRRLG